MAAPHGLLLDGAGERLNYRAIREVVADTVPVATHDWPRLRVVSVAPLRPAALERFLADGSIGDLF